MRVRVCARVHVRAKHALITGKQSERRDYVVIRATIQVDIFRTIAREKVRAR